MISLREFWNSSELFDSLFKHGGALSETDSPAFLKGQFMFSDKFIKASDDYSTYIHFVSAPYFRKSFEIKRNAKKCVLTITGLGFYDAYINGRKITKGILAPYISNPDDIVFYDEYDITPFISDGKNVLGIHLGNGMLNCVGGGIWDFDKALFRSAPQTAFSIETEYKDGSSFSEEADENVKTAPSPVIFDDLRCGCFYDARSEIDGWADIDFDDSNWKNALRAMPTRGEKRLCTAEAIKPQRIIKPVKIRKCILKDYHPRGDVPKEYKVFPSKEHEGFLYDFGINTAGTVRLKIKGERGRQIDLQFGEYYAPDGEPDTSNICFCPDGYSQRDIYILKGEGEEEFEPVFTYHGFRYCVVLGITEEEATNDLLEFIVYNSDIKELGSFSCSDDTANALQKMTRNSDLSNFYYFPTDCPHREKNGWTGDAALSCEHVLMNLDAVNSYKEWLNNIRAAQRLDGALPGIVPTAGWGFEWGNGPAWDSALTYIPYFSYVLRGDREILEDNACAIFRYCAYISSRRNERGLIAIGLGDWCPVTEVKSPLEFTDSVTCMSILEKASYIFGVLSKTAEKEYCDSLYSSIRASVRKYLINFNTMTAIGSCQTSQAMAVYYNVFDNAEKPEAVKRLVEIINRSDCHVDAGILGMRVLFRVLSDFGYSSLAFKMITRRDYPSYGNFVERGLTALPEDFLRETDRPNSQNHHMFGDISAWFIEYCAGIKVNPYRNDSSFVQISPCFIGELDYAEGEYETVGGKIKVNWLRTDGKIKLTVIADEGVHGEIIIPSEYSIEDNGGNYAELENGEYMLELNK